MSYADRTRRPPRTLTDAEQTKLLKVSGKHADTFRDHMIFSLALGTGLRESEIVGLDVGDVWGSGKAKRMIQLRVFKGHKRKDADAKSQRVHLPDGCYYKLEKYLKARDADGFRPCGRRADSPLFWSRLGRRLSTRRVRELFAEWQARAAFGTRYTFHELRHSAGTNAYRATKDIRIAQRVLRHANIHTTTRYEHASDQEVATAVRGLAS